MVFQNNEGQLELVSEVPTGVSPRGAAVADFNDDGQLDAAVFNRISSDISILPTHGETSSLSKLDQVYATDGEVTSLQIADIDRDGREDVVQLHRASRRFQRAVFQRARRLE